MKHGMENLAMNWERTVQKLARKQGRKYEKMQQATRQLVCKEGCKEIGK